MKTKHLKEKVERERSGVPVGTDDDGESGSGSSSGGVGRKVLRKKKLEAETKEAMGDASAEIEDALLLDGSGQDESERRKLQAVLTRQRAFEEDEKRKLRKEKGERLARIAELRFGASEPGKAREEELSL